MADTPKNKQENQNRDEQATKQLAQSITNQFQIFQARDADLTTKVQRAGEALTAVAVNISKLSSYATTISTATQNIAVKMGVYTAMLKDSRKESTKQTATGRAAGGLSTFIGANRSLRDVDKRGGLLGVLSGGFMSGAGRALGQAGGRLAGRAATRVATATRGAAGKVASRVGAAASGASKITGSAIMKMMKSPATIVIALVAALGTGIYKYFTDEGFKKSVNEFISSSLAMGKEYILDPIMSMFTSLKIGLHDTMSSVFAHFTGLEIPVPQLLQDLGLPAKLAPFAFLRSAAQSQSSAAAEGRKAQAAAKETKVAEKDKDKQPKQPVESAAPMEAAKPAVKASEPAPTPSAKPALPPSKPEAKDASKAAPAPTPSVTPVSSEMPSGISSEDRAIMAMIMQHEGVEYKPYKDSRGLWTVGVGHLIGDGKSLPAEYNRTFTKQEVDKMFVEDYLHHKKAAAKIPGFSMLGKDGQAALIDMTFNMGPGWYKKWPKFLKNLTEGDSTGAVEELTTSAWYGQVKSRAKTIVSMIKSGMEGAGSKLAAMSSKTSAAPTMTASAAPPATVKSKPTAVASSGASGGGGSTGTAPTPANVATNKLEKSLAKDSSLAVQAPSQGAQPVAPSPSSGTQLGAASATVADLKNAPKKDVAIVDNSKISRSRVSQLTEGGSIPSPIADRGSIDLFNFFEPPGGMKA